MSTFAENMIQFYSGLRLKLKRSKDVQVLNPFTEAEVIKASAWYHNKYCKSHQNPYL